jgi:hypothetical protein
MWMHVLLFLVQPEIRALNKERTSLSSSAAPKVRTSVLVFFLLFDPLVTGAALFATTARVAGLPRAGAAFP